MATTQLPLAELKPGHVINWGTSKETVRKIETAPGIGKRVLYRVWFQENEPEAAPALFTQNTSLPVERVN